MDAVQVPSFNESEFSGQGKFEKTKPFLSAVHYYLVQIWPSINKTLNFFFYHTIRILKVFVKFSLQQIGLMKEI